MLPGKGQGVHHIGGAPASGDEGRSSVDEAIVDPSSLLVGGVRGIHDAALQRSLEALDSIVRKLACGRAGLHSEVGGLDACGCQTRRRLSWARSRQTP